MDGIRPILAADDNPDDIRLLEFAWRSAKVAANLQSVSDGEQAVAYLTGAEPFADRERFPLPRLLLLDLKMPRKDGFEVLQWLRATPAFHCLPVIVLTASLHKDDVQRAYDLGANAFLVKPVELKHLVDMVKAIDTFWLTHNQFPTL